MKQNDSLKKICEKYHRQFRSYPMVGAALIRRKTHFDWDKCEEISHQIAKMREKSGLGNKKIPWSKRNIVLHPA